MVRSPVRAAGRTRSTPAVAEWTHDRLRRPREDAFERRGGQRAAEHHLDVVERSVREPFERHGDEPGAGRGRGDALQVLARGSAPTGWA